MFAWIDLLYFAAGVALGVEFKDKIEAVIHGAEGYVTVLEAKLATAKAKLESLVTTAKADVDVAKAAAETIKKTV